MPPMAAEAPVPMASAAELVATVLSNNVPWTVDCANAVVARAKQHECKAISSHNVTFL